MTGGNRLAGRVKKAEAQFGSLLERAGYDPRNWGRVVMNDTCTEWLRELHPEKLDALEISAGNYWRPLGFKTFTEANYPEYDVCAGPLEQQFDVVIADQIFEHLLWPYSAARHIHQMLKDGGYFFITTPFMVRVHLAPYDCTRWTETGMQYFLAEAGFALEDIRTGSWGNRACVKGNFRTFPPRGWMRSLKNEPDFPVAVWALAQKNQES